MSVAIVVQGPLNKVSLTNIPNYAKFGKVVLSFWHGDNKDLLLDLCGGRTKKVVMSDEKTMSVALNSYLNDVALVETMSPPDIFWHNDMNVWRQVTTTLRGIEATYADVIVKVRADESYSDLTQILAEQARTKKVVTNNVYFRKTRPFHASDHLIVAERNLFLEAMRDAKRYCEMSPPGGTPLVPEEIITRAFLRVRGVPLRAERSRDFMIDNFAVVPVTKLGEFKVAMHDSEGKRKYMSSYDPWMFQADTCIFDNMNDLY